MKGKLMKLISVGLLLLLASSVHSASLRILSEYLCPLEMDRWNPVLIDSFQSLESGEMRISVSRDFPFIRYPIKSWTIVIDSTGCPKSCDENVPDNRLFLSTSQLGGLRERSLIVRTEQYDTLCTCILEGTNEYHAIPQATELADGGYLIYNPPDRFDIFVEIHSISSAGEMIWHYSLGTDYLLDLPEPVGEDHPQVRSLRKTSSGDILVGGLVFDSYTDPNTWFVCLLDGDTGNPLWKTTGCALGNATVHDVIETSSGLIVAVGSTARIVESEDFDSPSCGPGFPFIAALNSTGELQKLVILETDLSDMFYNIIETNPLECEFLIAGNDRISNELVLLRTIIPTDPEGW